jgi:hypothetical protein
MKTPETEMIQHNYLLTLIAPLLIFSWFLPAHASEVLVKEAGRFICSIEINGEIDQKTPVQIDDALLSLGIQPKEMKRFERLEKVCPLLTVSLNSSGGDVDAAMKAGIRLREMWVNTVVHARHSCSSACVLLFVGGVYRYVDGQIGLHRPFSSHLSTGEPDSRASYEQINRRIKLYLQAQNIPERLLDEMNTVAPSRIRWLDGHESRDELTSDLSR